MRSNQKKPEAIKRLAKDRIDKLFSRAGENFQRKPELADRYVELARKIAMKAKIRMPRQCKRQYCSHCYKYIRTGSNSTIRIHRSKIIISCGNCKKFTRIPLNVSRVRQPGSAVTQM